MKQRFKSLYYLLAKQPYKLEKPIVLQFPVIDICNSRCQMCRIWENKQSDDITAEQLRVGLQNKLYSEVASVGLNGGEPTLRKDLADLAQVLFEELPKLKNITLITNSFKYKEVIQRIMEVGEVVKKFNGRLSVMVSLDGVGELHDIVRGKPGNFERAQHVLEYAMASELVHGVRVGCTIIKENVYGIHDLLDFCQKKGVAVKYRLGIPHQRLYTDTLSEPYTLNFAEKYHIAEFMEGLLRHYESSDVQRETYKSLIGQLVHDKPRSVGCEWKHRGATITSKGELLYCAVESDVLGSIATENSEAIYFGHESHLQEIIKNKCDNCSHDYTGLPPKKAQLHQLVKKLKKKARLDKLSNLPLLDKLRNEVRAIKYQQKSKRLNQIVSRTEKTLLASDSNTRILLCGWYGTETLGDKAILAGVIAALKACYSDASFTLVSLYPYISVMTRSQMPELEGVKIITPNEGIEQVANMDLAVFAGGPLMALDELLEMEAIFKAAKKNKVKTLIAGCGVGPKGNTRHNQSIKNILELADHRIYRDTNSQEIASSLGVDVSKDWVSEDPAFTWLSSMANTSKQNLKSNDSGKVLLLGLRDFPYRKYAAELSEKEALAIKARFEREVVIALEQLAIENKDLTIRPLPMCTNHFGSDDQWFYRSLFLNNNILKERLDYSLLNGELPPNDYIEAFNHADASLTMRFHSAVFSLGLSLPTTCIDYTMGKGKVKAVAEKYGVDCLSMHDLKASTITASLTKILNTPPQSQDLTLTFTESVKKALKVTQ